MVAYYLQVRRVPEDGYFVFEKSSKTVIIITLFTIIGFSNEK
jgi:hypothetical protein